jgi:hypothetical protein
VEAVCGGCSWRLFVEVVRSNSIRAKQFVKVVVQTVRSNSCETYSNSCEAVCKGNS